MAIEAKNSDREYKIVTSKNSVQTKSSHLQMAQSGPKRPFSRFWQSFQATLPETIEKTRYIVPSIQLKNILEMRFKERDQSSVRSYQRISLGKRKRLVELVVDQGQPLSKIVKKLKIKLTTARLIITKYRETGSFPMRDFKKRAIKQHNSSRSQEQHQQSRPHYCVEPDIVQNCQPVPEPVGNFGSCYSSYPMQYVYYNGCGLFLIPYNSN